MTASCELTSCQLLPLLSSASVEISSHGHQLSELSEQFAAGTDVTITFLPGDNFRSNVETAIALRRAGFNPVPHIAVRRLAGGNAVTRTPPTAISPLVGASCRAIMRRVVVLPQPDGPRRQQ